MAENNILQNVVANDILQVLAASCLEIWAMHQPGGDTLHLRIQVNSKTGKLEAKVHF